MRNKWYVLGIGGVALVMAVIAARAYFNDSSAILVAPPAVIAAALAFAAYKVANAQSFAPTGGRKSNEFNVGTHTTRPRK